jgi:adenylate cyclase
MNSRSAVWRALRTALLVAAVLAALGHASGWAPLRFVTLVDLAISDARLRAFMPRTLDPRIVIVDIDEKSLAEIGRWPWGRDTMAALVDELFTNQGAPVVGFDMVFAEPDNNSAFAALRQMVRRSPELSSKIGTQVESMAPEFDLVGTRRQTDRVFELGRLRVEHRGARTRRACGWVFQQRARSRRPRADVAAHRAARCRAL